MSLKHLRKYVYDEIDSANEEKRKYPRTKTLSVRGVFIFISKRNKNAICFVSGGCADLWLLNRM